MDIKNGDYVISIYSFPIKHNNAYLNDKFPWYHPFLHDVKMPVNSFPHSNLVHTRVNTN